MTDVNWVRFESIEGQPDLLIREERMDPETKQRGKAKVGNNGDHTFDVDVVKKTLYVE